MSDLQHRSNSYMHPKILSEGNTMVPSCHICDSDRVTEIEGFSQLVRVTSDCVVLPSGGGLLVCRTCSTVVTLNDKIWRDMTTKIYRDYSPYAQGSGAEEKTYTVAGSSLPRSERIVDLVSPHLPSTTGVWMDFGCGNGAFLRTVNRRFPEIPLLGMEFDDHQQESVMSIPGVLGLVTNWDDSLLNNMAIVSLIHVLEHMENPVELLKKIKHRMQNQGLLLVQVPHIWTNPYVLTVGDHITHFDLPSLERLIRSAGFEIEWKIADLIPGDLIVLARKVPPSLNSIWQNNASEPDWRASDSYGSSVQSLVDGLTNVTKWLSQCRQDFQAMGIFGTSVAGTWAGATLDNKHDFWIDEDPSRIGKWWQEKEILPLKQIPTGSGVAVILGKLKVDAVIRRLSESVIDSLFVKPPFK